MAKTAVRRLVVTKKIKNVVKRDGRIVPFDKERITVAVGKAMMASGEVRDGAPELVRDAVVADLQAHLAADASFVPTVEQVQDIVERQLILNQFPATAKAYILYREKHAKMRAEGREVPEHVRKLADESATYFPNKLS